MTRRRATVLCALTALGSVAVFAAGIYALIDKRLP